MTYLIHIVELGSSNNGKPVCGFSQMYPKHKANTPAQSQTCSIPFMIG